MNWEEEEFGSHHVKPRVWQENVAALAKVTPSGKLTTTHRVSGNTVELNPDVESHILSFLAPNRLTARRRTPANLLRAERFKRNIGKGAMAVTARRERKEKADRMQRQMELLKEEMEANRAQEEAEEARLQEDREIEDERARRFMEEQGRKANLEEYIKNANMRSSPIYQAAFRRKQGYNARTKSRARRGVLNKTSKNRQTKSKRK